MPELAPVRKIRFMAGCPKKDAFDLNSSNGKRSSLLAFLQDVAQNSHRSRAISAADIHPRNPGSFVRSWRSTHARLALDLAGSDREPSPHLGMSSRSNATAGRNRSRRPGIFASAATPLRDPGVAGEDSASANLASGK